MRDVLLDIAATSDVEQRERACEALVKLFDIYRMPYPDKALTDIQGSLSTTRFELAVICENIRSDADTPIKLENVFLSVTA